jgi:hypothetical protein
MAGWAEVLQHSGAAMKAGRSHGLNKGVPRYLVYLTTTYCTAYYQGWEKDALNERFSFKPPRRRCLLLVLQAGKMLTC